MKNQIESLEDVNQFINILISELGSFHPDDDFRDYIDMEKNIPTYTTEEGDLRNSLMSKCIEICGESNVDLYDLVMEKILTESGMDNLIPLP